MASIIPIIDKNSEMNWSPMVWRIPLILVHVGMFMNRCTNPFLMVHCLTYISCSVIYRAINDVYTKIGYKIVFAAIFIIFWE